MREEGPELGLIPPPPAMSQVPKHGAGGGMVNGGGRVGALSTGAGDHGWGQPPGV